MTTSIGAIITAEAGGAWKGHTFFKVVNPLNQCEDKFNSILGVENFCTKHNLVFDRDLMGQLLCKLKFSLDNGWSVPKEHLEEGNCILSSIRYLNKIQIDLF